MLAKQTNKGSGCSRARASSSIFRVTVARRLVIKANKSEQDTTLANVSNTVKGFVDAGKGVVEKVAEFIPESVPRPAAKAGVTIAAGLFVIWLLQKLISTVLTIALLGGVGYLYFTTQSKPSQKEPAIDDDDPMARAKNIMDKYK